MISLSDSFVQLKPSVDPFLIVTFSSTSSMSVLSLLFSIFSSRLCSWESRLFPLLTVPSVPLVAVRLCKASNECM